MKKGGLECLVDQNVKHFWDAGLGCCKKLRMLIYARDCYQN